MRPAVVRRSSSFIYLREFFLLLLVPFCVCVFRFDPLSFRFKKVSKFHPSISIHTTHYPAKYPLGLNLLSLTLLNISEREEKMVVLLLSLPFFFLRRKKQNKKEEKNLRSRFMHTHTHLYVCIQQLGFRGKR